MTGAVFIVASHILITVMFVLACRLKNSKYFLMGNFLLLLGYVFYIVISCFRKIDYGWGGDDAIGYKNIFEKSNLSFYDYFFIESKKEYGFRMVLWLVRRIADDYRYCLFVFHSIVYICTSYFFLNIKKNQKICANAVMIYLISANLFFTFHLMRSGVAISICMVYFILFEQKKYWKASVVLIAAISFHYSAWMVVISSIPFVISDKFGVNVKSIMKLYVPLGVIAEFIVLSRTKGTLPYYFMYDNHNGMSDGTIAAFMVLLVLLIFFKRKTEKKYEYYEMMLLTTVLIIPVNLFYTIANRIWLIYFSLIYKIIAEAQLDGMQFNGTKVRLVKREFMIVLFCISYCMIRFYLVAFREDFAYTLQYALEF